MNDPIQSPQLGDCQWISRALNQLLEQQNEDLGWGYQRESISATEPTALACLAFLAYPEAQETWGSDPVEKGAFWLAGTQQENGALGVSRDLPVHSWPTAYAALAWQNVPGYERAGEKALRWLLRQKGEQGDPSDLVSHNPKLQGWPWIANTFSWLEPTAVSVLALRHAGSSDHPRAVEGIQLILDRAIAGGGWNYGNRRIFGKELRPQPATTGLGLMGLADIKGNNDIIDQACSYLANVMTTIRSPMSLCWGLLGLTAWNRRPECCENWVQEGFDRVQRTGCSTTELAYLMLAASKNSWDLFRPKNCGVEA
jgi:hypothetical protein